MHELAFLFQCVIFKGIFHQRLCCAQLQLSVQVPGPIRLNRNVGIGCLSLGWDLSGNSLPRASERKAGKQLFYFYASVFGLLDMLCYSSVFTIDILIKHD